MAKLKIYRDSSNIRYEGKLYETLRARMGDKYAEKVAPLIESTWESRFMVYHRMYEQLKEFLSNPRNTNGVVVPKALYGLYRSFLFYAYKEINTGTEPEAVIRRFKNKAGLDEGVMRAILRYFGLMKEVTPANTQTNSAV